MLQSSIVQNQAIDSGTMVGATMVGGNYFSSQSVWLMRAAQKLGPHMVQ